MLKSIVGCPYWNLSQASLVIGWSSPWRFPGRRESEAVQAFGKDQATPGPTHDSIPSLVSGEEGRGCIPQLLAPPLTTGHSPQHQGAGVPWGAAWSPAGAWRGLPVTPNTKESHSSVFMTALVASQCSVMARRFSGRIQLFF